MSLGDGLAPNKWQANTWMYDQFIDDIWVMNSWKCMGAYSAVWLEMPWC